MSDDPFTREEFYVWIQHSFGPHLEDEKIAHARLERVYVAMFGDGNGDAGVRADVKKLTCIAMRIDHWLDGTARLWKFFVALALPIIALAGFAKGFGWL